MEAIGLETFASYGLSGIVIAFLFGFIIFRDKAHTQERKELIQSYSNDIGKFQNIWEKSTTELIVIMRETNSEIRSLRESLWVAVDRRNVNP